jgi:hypothetical protein
MKAIPDKVHSFRSDSSSLAPLTVDEVRESGGHLVETYSGLIAKLAQLAFANPEMVLLMRGQSREYIEKGKSTLYPTMYRTGSDEIYAAELRDRYELLRQREQALYEVLRYTDYWERVGRSDLARWAILQHYEVCPTPLLDVTHSALVACSFAWLSQGMSPGGEFFLYVLGLPQISGSITVAPAQALQVIRLSNVCPPETLRPYFQEGYLIGTYPSVDTLDEKMRYFRAEMDGARRLVAKFRIPRVDEFWDNGFQRLPETALYPDNDGELCHQLAQLGAA